MLLPLQGAIQLCAETQGVAQGCDLVGFQPAVPCTYVCCDSMCNSKKIRTPLRTCGFFI